jgi:sigma-E processing peptidase SpoIIGA
MRYNCLDGGEAMEQTVYIDLYFMINFGMDFLCFFLTGRLLSLRVSVLRCILASALGGAYACAALFLPLGALSSVVLDVAACVLISAVAFLSRREWKHLPVYALVYTAVSILLGGFMTVLFGIFNRLGLDRLLGSEDDADGLSVWLFLVLAVLGGLCASFGGKHLRRKSGRKNCRLEMRYGSRVGSFSALCDSGNMLREPISNKLCVIVELRAARSFLPSDMLAAIEQRRSELLLPENARRLRVIPVRTVGGGGMMYAFRMDGVRVDMGKGFREVDAFVAFCTEELKGGVSALVPSELAMI